MNIFLWVLQVLLALHTLAGAVWKFSKTAGQTMPSLSAIPQSVWMGMGLIEILCSLGLVLPFFNKSLGFPVPGAAACIAVEMLILCAVHLSSGDSTAGPMVYWGVVALFCAFIVYGRLVLKPF